MITYLFLFSVPKLNLVLAKRLKGTAKKSIETALNRQQIKYESLEELGGGFLVWSVQPADQPSMHKLLQMTESSYG